MEYVLEYKIQRGNGVSRIPPLLLQHPLHEGHVQCRCSIKYVALPNNSHLHNCACASLVRRCLFIEYLFLQLGLGVGLVVVLGLGLIIPTCRANFVLRVTWQCDVFGMTPARVCLSTRLHALLAINSTLIGRLVALVRRTC